MDKPFSITVKEFKEKLTDLINKSKIPACVIELILQNYLFEISDISNKQYEYDRSNYENSQDVKN